MKKQLSKKERYLTKKMKEIEAEIAIAVGAANIAGVMFGKCTDSVIEGRDAATKKVQKIVIQMLNRVANDHI